MDNSSDSKQAAETLIPGFNLDALRLPQNFGDSFGVQRVVTRVPVRKPLKTDFFRIRPGDDWRLQAVILELKEEGETYVLTAVARAALPDVARPAMLHTAIDRRNNVFLVPVPMPGPDGRRISWHESLAEVVVAAETKWVRSVANKATSAYDMYVAQGAMPEPEWPSIAFDQVMQIAFRGRVIESVEHPVVKQLLGIT